jgi:hypothetical protein
MRPSWIVSSVVKSNLHESSLDHALDRAYAWAKVGNAKIQKAWPSHLSHSYILPHKFTLLQQGISWGWSLLASAVILSDATKENEQGCRLSWWMGKPPNIGKINAIQLNGLEHNEGVALHDWLIINSLDIQDLNAQVSMGWLIWISLEGRSILAFNLSWSLLTLKALQCHIWRGWIMRTL